MSASTSQQPEQQAPAANGANAQTSGAAAPFAPQPTASLYVGELDPSVSEAFLFEMFNVIGPVASVRVCRDAVTRRSLGYAYVNFHMMADGERALEQLNYTPIKGRPCRIMWSQRDPSLRKSGSGNIFIKNLDPSIDNKALHDTFMAFGKILSAKVATRDGQSLGYGFVHYESSESAKAAIENVNGMLLNDKPVFVGLHAPKKVREAEKAAQRAQFTNLFFKNLPEDLDDAELEKMCSEFGAIVSAKVQSDDEGKSKCFGFVNFESHEAAQACLDALNNKEVRGKPLYVSRAQKKAEREAELRRQYEQQRQERMQKFQGSNIYIKNLDDNFDDDKLRAEFAPFGNITSAKIMLDDKGNSKGFGFVCFSSPDEAAKAVAEMHNKMIGSKPIFVALAQRKDQRRAQLEAERARNAALHPQQPYRGMPMQPGGPLMPHGAIYPGQPMYFQPGPGGQPRGFFGPGGPGAMQQGGRPAPQRWQQPVQPGMIPPGAVPYPIPQFPGHPMGGAPVMPGGPNQGGNGGHQGGPRPNRGGRGGHNMRGGQQQRMPRGPHPNAQGGFKYTATARNMTAANQQQQQQPQSQQAAATPQQTPAAAAAPAPAAQPESQSGLTAAALAAATPEQQKQMLGEALFPLIFAKEAELAPKITGMLLEMEPTEVLHLIESPNDLTLKVAEAADLVRKHQDEAGDE